VILLRVVADLSLEQVAAVVDKPVTAVKALQRRGLRRLQSEVLAEVLTP
jgi:RNA polymerase sigma-70 factor (ECF subfamily)